MNQKAFSRNSWRYRTLEFAHYQFRRVVNSTYRVKFTEMPVKIMACDFRMQIFLGFFVWASTMLLEFLGTLLGQIPPKIIRNILIFILGALILSTFFITIAMAYTEPDLLVLKVCTFIVSNAIIFIMLLVGVKYRRLLGLWLTALKQCVVDLKHKFCRTEIEFVD